MIKSASLSVLDLITNSKPSIKKCHSLTEVRKNANIDFKLDVQDRESQYTDADSDKDKDKDDLNEIKKMLEEAEGPKNYQRRRNNAVADEDSNSLYLIAARFGSQVRDLPVEARQKYLVENRNYCDKRTFRSYYRGKSKRSDLPKTPPKRINHNHIIPPDSAFQELLKIGFSPTKLFVQDSEEPLIVPKTKSRLNLVPPWEFHSNEGHALITDNFFSAESIPPSESILYRNKYVALLGKNRTLPVATFEPKFIPKLKQPSPPRTKRLGPSLGAENLPKVNNETNKPYSECMIMPAIKIIKGKSHHVPAVDAFINYTLNNQYPPVKAPIKSIVQDLSDLSISKFKAPEKNPIMSSIAGVEFRTRNCTRHFKVRTAFYKTPVDSVVPKVPQLVIRRTAIERINNTNLKKTNLVVCSQKYI